MARKRQSATTRPGSASPPGGPSPASAAAARPSWDDVPRELRVGRVLIKRFVQPALMQAAILAAFQESGWPHEIDDPLRPTPGIDPKRRLNDAVKSLNRCQRANVIRFRTARRGTAIRWEWTSAARSE